MQKQHGIIYLLFIILLVGCKSTPPPIQVEEMPKGGYKFDNVEIYQFKSNNRKYNGNDFASTLTQKIIGQGHVKQRNGSYNHVVGKITAPRIEKIKQRTKKEHKDGTTYKYYYRLIQSLTVSFSVVRNKSVIVSDTLSFTYNEKFRSTDSYSDAIGQAPSEEAIAQKLLQDAAIGVSQYITPYYSNQEVTLLDGDDDNIDLGNEYVMKKRLKQAYSIYDQIANKTKDNEDQAIAIHNQGIVRLMQARYKESFNLIANANRIDPSNMDILDSLVIVETLKIKSDGIKEFKK